MPGVSATRTARHFFFSILLNRYGPHSFEVRDEVLLSKEPPRIDYLLLRKLAELALGDTGQTLHQLWPLLPRVSVVELKTVGRPYRTGDLDKLWSYVHAYFAHEHRRLDGRDDLCAVLIVPARTPSLDSDARAMTLAWCDLGTGYWRLTGGLFTLHVVELDVVGRQDDEDLLALFSRNDMRTPRALQFWGELLGSKVANMDVQQLEGYDELVRKLLSALPPEQRLAGLAPEQRLAGLPPEQLVLALPDDMLRKLPDEFLATLSDGAHAAIRKRLDH
jgi:hypothetical protein